VRDKENTVQGVFELRKAKCYKGILAQNEHWGDGRPNIPSGSAVQRRKKIVRGGEEAGEGSAGKSFTHLCITARGSESCVGQGQDR